METTASKFLELRNKSAARPPEMPDTLMGSGVSGFLSAASFSSSFRKYSSSAAHRRRRVSETHKTAPA